MDNYILQKILTTLNLSDSTIAIKKYGARREILFPELISALIDGGNMIQASILLGITEPTLESQMYKYVSKLLPTKSRSERWSNALLRVIEYKQCAKCGLIAHSSNFYNTINNTCIICSKAESKKYRENNREKLRVDAIKYRIDNKETLDIYYHSDKYLLMKKEYRDNNKGLIKAGNAKRRAAEIQATRNYDYGDQEELDIISFYNNCPEGMHVDHWAPLQGVLVCGLHNLANLQYLTVAENLSKGNKFLVE